LVHFSSLPHLPLQHAPPFWHHSPLLPQQVVLLQVA